MTIDNFRVDPPQSLIDITRNHNGPHQLLECVKIIGHIKQSSDVTFIF